MIFRLLFEIRPGFLRQEVIKGGRLYRYVFIIPALMLAKQNPAKFDMEKGYFSINDLERIDITFIAIILIPYSCWFYLYANIEILQNLFHLDKFATFLFYCMLLSFLIPSYYEFSILLEGTKKWAIVLLLKALLFIAIVLPFMLIYAKDYVFICYMLYLVISLIPINTPKELRTMTENDKAVTIEDQYEKDELLTGFKFL